jgi:indole-3-glycerol phosphate synthase
MAGGILDRIVETKRREVETLLREEGELSRRVLDAPPPRDLLRALRGGREVRVMAEVKRRSPGAGLIRPDLNPAEVAGMYAAAGAAAISVLTDEEYFGGSLMDLESVRKAVSVPILRKEFILHPVQLLQARVAGADGTLLIARILDDQALRSLQKVARDLGLTPLVEVHDGEELERALAAEAALIGINNRNLQTFTTSLETTLELIPRIPSRVTVVSESGIRTPEEVDRLGAAGVHAILVGETFLRAPHPGAAAALLVGRKRTGGSEPGSIGG